MTEFAWQRFHIRTKGGLVVKIDSEKVDIKRLQKIYRESSAARAVLDHCASRERNWIETTVDRLQINVAQEGTSLSRGEVIEVLKGLEAVGCGTFLVGRRGQPSRFRWDVGMVSVGQAAAGESVEIDQTVDNQTEEQGARMVKHPFPLRRGLRVEVELPDDLSPHEASRLADWVKTLPVTS